jgi:ketosteroid isomerase-like protein
MRPAPATCSRPISSPKCEARGVRGKKATCDRIAAALADDTRRLTYSADIEEIIVSGDLAAVRLVWTFRVRKGGEDRVSREPGLDLFRRQPDGAWRIARFLAYSEERDE